MTPTLARVSDRLAASRALMADAAEPQRPSNARVSDYLPYDERETLRCLCGLLLDTVSAVKGAQSALDDSGELLRKAAESQVAAAEAVQRSAELLRRLVAVTMWLDARHELMQSARPDIGNGGG